MYAVDLLTLMLCRCTDYRHGKKPILTHFEDDLLYPVDSPDPPWTSFSALDPFPRHRKVSLSHSSRTNLSSSPSSRNTSMRSPAIDEIRKSDSNVNRRGRRRRGGSHRTSNEEVFSSRNEAEHESLRSLVSFSPFSRRDHSR